MNTHLIFSEGFKKDGTPRSRHSKWGERNSAIQTRKDNSEWELNNGYTLWRGEEVEEECLVCGSKSARKIYCLKSKSVRPILQSHPHFAKLECVGCYRILRWLPKPKSL